jgi:arsenite-transporting ATPase
MTEFVMFGGKGGVGKTTCASSTALSLAKDGYETLVVSTDPAHSITDVFEKDIDAEPTRIRDNVPLFAAEVDPKHRFEENYEETAEALINEASNIGVNIDTEKFEGLDGGVIGSDEAAVIDLFNEYNNSDQWEYVVFDTAPTGHTLRMLKLPELLDGVFGTALNIKSRYEDVKGTVTSVIPGNDEDDEEKDLEDVDVEDTKNKLQVVSDLLQDPSKTQFFVVMEAEELSLLETNRLINDLKSYEIHVGGVFINKVLDDIDEDCSLCSSRYKNQQEVIQEANNDIEYPLLQIPLQEDPPRGRDLDSIAETINVS